MTTDAAAASPSIRHGIRTNVTQILLLVALVAFVGIMIGVERTVLPLLGRDVFGLESVTIITSFIVAFGITKAFTNLVAGNLADRLGRKKILLAGWLAAVPVPLLIMFAPSWEWVVLANMLLAVNQGLCWTVLLMMKIDLGGPTRRGFAAGLNETIGYGFVALAGLAATEVAAQYGLRPYPYLIAVVAALVGLALTFFALRETRGHVDKEHRDGNGTEHAPSWRSIFGRVSFGDLRLFGAVQAGMVRNLADGMAWGLLLLMFAQSLGQRDAGTLQWVMIACFAAGQVGAGFWSDVAGRKPFVVVGMGLIAGALAWIAVTTGLLPWLWGVVMLGIGGALMYPTAIGSVADHVAPRWRATGLGVYRFWRDIGYAVGALLSGLVADSLGMRTAVLVVAAICLVSAAVAATLMRDARRPALSLERSPAPT